MICLRSICATSLVASAIAGTVLGVVACSSRIAEEDCEPYENDPGSSAPFEITIENHRAEPIFVPPVGGCWTGIDLEISDADGPVTWEGIIATCEDLFDNGCVYPADCAGGPTIRIDPGGRYVTHWGRVRYDDIEMPSGCFARPQMCGPTCWQQQPADDGDYSFATQAGSTIAQCETNPTDCECIANVDGWCEVWNVWEQATDLTTKTAHASLPDDDSAQIIFD